MKSLIFSAAAAVLMHIALFAVSAERQKPVRILPLQRAVRVSLSAAPRPVAPLKPLKDLTAAPVAPLQPLALKQPPPSKPRPKPRAPAPQPVAAAKSKELPPQRVAPDKAVEPPQRVAPDKTVEPPPADSTPAGQPDLPSSSISAEPAPDGVAAVAEKSQPVGQVEPDQTQPAYELNPPPEYPLQARRRNYQGTVLLNVLVDAQGRVAQIELVRSSGHDLLDRQAHKSVSQWRFQPATRNGQAVESWVEIPVRFELK